VTGLGRVRVQKQAVEGNDPHGGHRRVFEGDRARVGVSHGITQKKASNIQNMTKVWNQELLKIIHFTNSCFNYSSQTCHFVHFFFINLACINKIYLNKECTVRCSTKTDGSMQYLELLMLVRIRRGQESCYTYIIRIKDLEKCTKYLWTLAIRLFECVLIPSTWDTTFL